MPNVISRIVVTIVGGVLSRTNLGPSHLAHQDAVRELSFRVRWQNRFIRIVRIRPSLRIVVTGVLVRPASRVVDQDRRLTCEDVVGVEVVNREVVGPVVACRAG